MHWTSCLKYWQGKVFKLHEESLSLPQYYQLFSIASWCFNLCTILIVYDFDLFHILYSYCILLCKGWSSILASKSTILSYPTIERDHFVAACFIYTLTLDVGKMDGITDSIYNTWKSYTAITMAKLAYLTCVVQF